MPAKKIAATDSKCAVTRKQMRHLAMLLHEAGLQRDLDQALSRVESLASRFRERMDRLGFRPSIEDWDRSFGSYTYSDRLIREVKSLSEAAYRKRWVGVGKADHLLLSFCVAIERYWNWATHRSLPRLKPEVLLLSGEGYRPALHGRARSNPLWLVLEAAGLKLSPRTVKDLIQYARSKPSTKAERNNREARTRKRSQPSRRSESPL